MSHSDIMSPNGLTNPLIGAMEEGFYQDSASLRRTSTDPIKSSNFDVNFSSSQSRNSSATSSENAFLKQKYLRRPPNLNIEDSIASQAFENIYDEGIYSPDASYNYQYRDTSTTNPIPSEILYRDISHTLNTSSDRFPMDQSYRMDENRFSQSYYPS